MFVFLKIATLLVAVLSTPSGSSMSSGVCGNGGVTCPDGQYCYANGGVSDPSSGNCLPACTDANGMPITGPTCSSDADCPGTPGVDQWACITDGFCIKPPLLCQ